MTTDPAGGLDAGGRTGCTTHVVAVPGLRQEAHPDGTPRPVLHVPRGGVITLVVELRCDSTEETTPDDPPEPDPTATPSG